MQREAKRMCLCLSRARRCGRSSGSLEGNKGALHFGSPSGASRDGREWRRGPKVEIRMGESGVSGGRAGASRYTKWVARLRPDGRWEW